MGISNNEKNPNCLAVKQMALDMLWGDFPSDLQLKDLPEYIESHLSQAKKVDEKFNSHQYPDDKLVFSKKNETIPLASLLTVYELSIIELMMELSGVENLVELSIQDIMNYSGVHNKNTITKSLKRLIDDGFIAIMFNRNKTHGTVYMLNPNINTIGRVNKNLLINTFWKRTGTANGIKSEPQKRWMELMDKEIYSKGYDRQECDGKKYRFNKPNEPNIKKAHSATDQKGNKEVKK